MTTLYKLTDENMKTQGGFAWKLGERRFATGSRGQGLCSSEFIHAYEHAELALFLNPIHSNFRAPRLFRAEGEIEATDGQLKIGVRSLVLVEELTLPAPTMLQHVAFAIYCGKAVCDDPKWNTWADSWLDGSDRSEAMAMAMARAAEAAARAAAGAMAMAMARAAEAAARAAAGARAAEAAARAAEAAARAARAAEAARAKPFSLQDLAVKALAFEG